MKRLIVDYKKLDKKMLELLTEKFPDGYDQSDIIRFKNSKNEIVEAVELRIDEVIYLVKTGVRPVKAIEDFDEDKDDINEDDDAAEGHPDDMEDDDSDD